jgi:hypothetical protein
MTSTYAGATSLSDLDAWSTLVSNRFRQPDGNGPPPPATAAGGSGASISELQSAANRIPAVGQSATYATAAPSSYANAESPYGGGGQTGFSPEDHRESIGRASSVASYTVTSRQPNSYGGGQSVQRQDGGVQDDPVWIPPSSRVPSQPSTTQDSYALPRTNSGGLGPTLHQPQNTLWQGTVEKLGRNLQAHHRMVIVADGCIFVCLTAGGVTRTIELQYVASLRLVPPSIVQIHINNEPDLVLQMATPELRFGFVSAVERGKSIVHQQTGMGVGAIDIVEASSVSVEYQAGGGSGQGTNQGSLVLPGTAGGVPQRFNEYAEEGQGQTFNGAPSRGASVGGGAPQQQQQAGSRSGSQSTAIRPSWTVPPIGSTSKAPSPSSVPTNPYANLTSDIIRSGSQPTQQQQQQLQTQSAQAQAQGYEEADPNSFPGRHDQRRRQIADLQAVMDSNVPFTAPTTIAQLQAQIDAQKAIIDELQKKSENQRIVEDLRKDLEHSKALIADLQTALRSQESVFQEMLRAQESLRVSEDIKSSLEKQVQLMREEKKAWKQVVEGKDKEIADLNDRLKLKEIEHQDELAQIRKAFAEYDANVASYLEGLRTGQQMLHGGNTSALASSVHGLHPPAAPAPVSVQPRAPSGIGYGKVPPQSVQQYGLDPYDAAAGSGAGASDSEALQSSLMNRLNNYANRKYNLPYGHPAPAGVPNNRYGPNGSHAASPSSVGRSSPAASATPPPAGAGAGHEPSSGDLGSTHRPRDRSIL